MTGSWNTHHGDDWWFAGGAVVADGAYNAAPAMFEITSIVGAPIHPDELRELLMQTLQQFAETKVLVILNNSTRPALVALADESSVVWREFKQPYSLWAHILSVVSPNNSSQPTPRHCEANIRCHGAQGASIARLLPARESSETFANLRSW